MKSIVVRNKVIKTASELFYQNGYNLTGINEIIKKSTVAKATLYNHFRSKDELCIAYIKYQNGKLLNSIATYLDNLSLNENKIIALFNFLNQFFETPNFNGSCCVNLVSEIPKDKITIRLAIKNQQNELLKLIKKTTNDTYISNSERENKSLAYQVYLLFETALVESHLQQNNNAITVAKKMCEFILKS